MKLSPRLKLTVGAVPLVLGAIFWSQRSSFLPEADSSDIKVVVPGEMGADELRDSWRNSVLQRDLKRLRYLGNEALKSPGKHLDWITRAASANEAEQEVREYAVALLARIGSAQAVRSMYSLLNEFPVGSESYANTLRAFEFIENPQASKLLMDLAKEEADVKAFPVLLTAAARCARDEVIAASCGVLASSGNDRERLVAEGVLRRIAPDRIAPYLEEEWGKSRNRDFRLFASIILGEDGSERSLQLLRRAYDEDTVGVRQQALDGLFRVHNIEALPTLEFLALQDSSQEVRQHAIYALRNFPQELAFEVLSRIEQGTSEAKLKKSISFVRSLFEKRVAGRDR